MLPSPTGGGGAAAAAHSYPTIEHFRRIYIDAPQQSLSLYC